MHDFVLIPMKADLRSLAIASLFALSACTLPACSDNSSEPTHKASHQSPDESAGQSSGQSAREAAGEAATLANTGISITDAYIAEAPPTARVMVGYMRLHNNTDQPVSFTRASSDSYSSIEFHETIHENGMARMIRHDSLDIPANGELVLKRGGRHLMMFNPVQAFKSGDVIRVNLHKPDGNTMPYDITVIKPDFGSQF